MKVYRGVSLAILLIGNFAIALAGGSSPSFPPYLSDGFDYATFTRFDGHAPQDCDLPIQRVHGAAGKGIWRAEGDYSCGRLTHSLQ